MNLPWVSRLAYDTACSERDRLRLQVDTLLVHVQKMDRVEHGLREVPHASRLPPVPMPQTVHDYIHGFANPSIRKVMLTQCYRRHAQGTSWETIEQDLKTQNETPQTLYATPETLSGDSP